MLDLFMIMFMICLCLSKYDILNKILFWFFMSKLVDPLIRRYSCITISSINFIVLVTFCVVQNRLVK